LRESALPPIRLSGETKSPAHSVGQKEKSWQDHLSGVSFKDALKALLKTPPPKKIKKP